jgi:RNA polymerase sigma factor (sigma-70 family)
VAAELLSELLVRCRAGDESAVAELVRRFRPWAVDFAAALLGGDFHLAEDAVQAAFLITLSRLGELREPNAFAGWFRQIVRTETRRIGRRRGNHVVVEVTDDAAPTDRASPLDAVELDERRAAVRAAIESLPRRASETAALHYLEELEIREVAQRLSIPSGTVKRRLHDAREKLRERLKLQLPL